MAFAPDILVTAPDEPHVALVVEAKVSMPNLERAEADLKEYMVQMQCPVGVLVTPERLRLYRDFYTTRTPSSVRSVGDFDMRNVWQEPPPKQAVQFEAFVQYWLEVLAKTPPAALPRDLRDALREHILPAIASGELRAAHPR